MSPELKRLMNTVGIETFVQYYHMPSREVIKRDLAKKGYAPTSVATKTSVMMKIRDTDKAHEVLRYIALEANKVPDYIKRRARQLYMENAS